MGRAEDLFERLETDGELAIDELLATRKSEELFLDFKRSSDEGSGARLSTTDRNNLAKAISGFGNSEGGVIIWGIDCSQDSRGGDVPHTKVPLEDAERFVSWLEGAVSGCTVPPHSSVRSIPIAGSFAGTLIPKSFQAPHQVVQGLKYYIRAGSDFVPAPHGVLSGLFGKRPLPHVFHKFVVEPATIQGEAIELTCGILVRNQGPGVAEDLYLNLTVLEPAAGGSQIAVEIPDESAWMGQHTFGTFTTLIARPGVRLPPEAHLVGVYLRIQLRPPFKSGIRASGMVGAGNSPPYRFELGSTRKHLEEIYGQTMKARESHKLTEEVLRDLPDALLGLSKQLTAKQPER